MNRNMTNIGGDRAETARRAAASFFQWAGWGYAFGIFLYATLNYNPNQGDFAPQWVGFTFIGSLCIGIAGTLVRSRMRLTDTIVSAFTAGAAAAQAAHQEHDDIVKRIEVIEK